jgi:hypothetical protein
MSQLTALVPGSVCAAAVSRPWPDDVDGQVRCIDEGTRALGLAHCCPPRAGEAHDPDEVAAGLDRTPGARPVLGIIEGPVSVSFAAGRGGGRADDVQDLLDDASDWAADRLRALSACGVRRVVIVEDAVPVPVDDDAIEAHRPLLNAAGHLRIDLVLVSTGLDAVEPLGYRCWASERSCSPGIGFLPAEEFESVAALDRWLDQSPAGNPDEVVTAPLAEGVSPDLVRHAARTVALGVARP